MLKYSILLITVFTLSITGCKQSSDQEVVSVSSSTNYNDLVELFKEWRAFEKPPLKDGAPDYTKGTFLSRWEAFKDLQVKLNAIDKSNWTVEEQVDWYIVWAEMNGYDFNHNILKPWERDPAYYKTVWMERSDVPAHEGPTHHMTTEVWTYDFPLSKEQKDKFIKEINVIAPLNEQAKTNLTGNAKELWIAGIRDIKNQSSDLKNILTYEGIQDEPDLVAAINGAIKSTDDLAAWLTQESSSKTGASGIGKDNYTWYLQNVHLVPLTWEDEVMILKNELAGAWTSLKLEEHRNRNLPEIDDVSSEEEYAFRADIAATSLMKFLEEQDIVTVKEYFEPALREHLGSYVPKETRNFFWITAHLDQRPLYSHFYHWFELAIMDNEPHKSEIRKGPLLYNIFDSRNEGTATAVEEMFMEAGLYDDSPRSREIVYIMIAQRAARGLGSLYAHANDMTMEEAGSIHSEYTPRGWMKTEKELLLFEQHLYLRQPGYGSSYITGKYLLKDAMQDYAKLKESKGEPFELKAFFDELNSIGSIPISLGHLQMTGENDELMDIVNAK